jgi:aspartate kinase
LRVLKLTRDLASALPLFEPSSLHFLQHTRQDAVRGANLLRAQGRLILMPDSISANFTLAVIKIGGSILKNARAYRRAARYVRNRYVASPDERFVVVVSAQEGVTDWLAATACQIISQPNSAALDLLWSTGELRSVALLALHLQALGVSAAALNIHEAGLALSDATRASGAVLEDVRFNSRRLRSVLVQNSVAVVPGFFATDTAGAVHSLGRGGSDLTAVLLAKGLSASRCELLKDVPGYFASDRHGNPSARHLPRLTFQEALALASQGCDLVQRRAIEVAAQCNLPLVVRSLDESAPLRLVTAQQEITSHNAGVLSSEAVAAT